MAELHFKKTIELMNKYGKEVVAEMLTRLNSYGKKATGNLAKSLTYSVEVNSETYSLNIVAAEYWKYVDKGRKPGKFVPVDALKKWAKVKGIPQSAVWPINYKIYKKGIRPTNFASTTLSRRKSKFEELVAKSYYEDMQIYFNSLAQEINNR